MSDHLDSKRMPQGARGTDSAAPEIAAPTLSLPEGGSISGFGDVFEPDEKTGAGTYRFPIPMPQAPGTTPDLALSFAGAAGNGPFGLGFNLNIPSIQRRTDRGVPRYDDSDEFVLGTGDVLVPRLDPDGAGGWKPVQRSEGDYLITVYRPRVVSGHLLIERWVDQSAGTSHWRLVDADNTETLLGTDATGRISDPAAPTHEFKWLAQQVVDALGNRVVYDYLPENDEGVPDTLGNAGRDHSANRYLASIGYGAYTDDSGNQRLAFQLLLDYGQYDLAALEAGDPVIHTSQPWAVRPDPFSTYRTGFEIRSYRRCLRLLSTCDFPDQLGWGPTLTGVIELGYDDELGGSRILTLRQRGYRVLSDGRYQTRAMPLKTLSYSRYDPFTPEWGKLEVPDGAGFPGRLDEGLYRLVDLYGEGLPGVLYADRNNLYYWRPLGEGRYASPVPLPQAPAEMRLQHPAYALQDLEGSGRLDLVVGTRSRGGFYGNRQNGSWIPYRSFLSYTAEYASPQTQLVDISGDGLTDLYSPTDQAIRYYPALGTDGFGPALSRPTAVELPTGNLQLDQRMVRFVDLLGSGLPGRVELRSGSVTVWPNLGHGRFGEPVIFAGAPILSSDLALNRILFADVTGNGYVDLLLVHADRVEVYPNLSGNCFGTSFQVPAPFPVTNRDQVFIADVFGNGGSCLVVSRPGTPSRQHFLDFTGRSRPGLLTQMDNGAGQRTEIRYRSSTDYALADAERGNPWVLRPAFPVQVVERITRIDEVGGSRVTRVFQYRDGYYDPMERRFIGFAMVQSQDSETFADGLWLFPTRNQVPAACLAEGDLPPLMAPALTQMWSLTGTYERWASLWSQMQDEYWQGDPQALSLVPFTLDDDIAHGDAQTQREASLALAGRILRHQTFGLDVHGAPASAPLMVRENNFHVRLLQPCSDGRSAVFQVIEQQRCESQYDGEAAEPRIQHQLVLALDDYGNPTRTAHVSYARRELPQGAPPTQGKTQVYLELSDYINVAAPFHRIGFKYQQQSLETAGLMPDNGRYFSVAGLAAQAAIALASRLPYGTPFTPGDRQSRPARWWQSYFWNDERSEVLPLGETTAQALLHHAQSAVMPQTLVDSLYDTTIVTNDYLREQGGYVYQPKEGYWWNPGSTASYAGADTYYVLNSSQDSFGNITRYGRDATGLAVVSVTNALDQTEIAEIDYQAFQPWRKTDVNGVVNEVGYDALGLIMVSTTYKLQVDGSTIGNAPLSDYRPKPPPSLSEALADPEAYLQGAGAYFAYELDTWSEYGTALDSLSLQRVDWLHPLDQSAAKSPRIRRQLTYIDGFGRALCRKDAVEGVAIDPTDGGGSDQLLWITSARAVLNDRSEAVKTYTPYVSSDYALDPIPVGEEFTRYAYDPLGRLIRTDTPKGFFSRSVYTSWTTVEYDVNDTVTDSSYYQNHIHDTAPAFARELAALQQAAHDADTPTSFDLNPRGQQVRVTRVNIDRESEGSADQTYSMVTDIWVDLEGNQLAVANPRFSNRANPERPSHLDFRNTYAMDDQVIRSLSADAGDTLLFRAVDDRIVDKWDAMDRRLTTSYDALRRQTGMRLWQGDASQQVQRIDYGTDATQLNVGRPVRQYDDAGRTETPSYDLSDNVVSAKLRYRVAYDGAPNWNDPDTVPLMPETWSRTWRYNALGEQEEAGNADGSTTVHRTFLNGWLDRLLLVSAAGEEQVVIDRLTYNALSGRREMVQGSGVTSLFDYDPKTYRLVAIRSQRVSDGKLLQDYSYVYDPVGNLISAVDAAQPTQFFKGEQVKAERDYDYDAIYRLVSASGRQQTPSGPLERYSRSYRYDLADNITRLQAVADSGGFTRDYSVAEASDRSVPAEWVDGGKSPENFYDAAGGLTSLNRSAPAPDLGALAYDYDGRLSRAVITPRQTGDPDAAYFNYTVDGARARKVVTRTTSGGVTEEQTFYIGDLVVVRSAPQGQTASTETVSLRMRAGDELALVTRSQRPVGGGAEQDQTARYQLQNLIGSVCIEVDATGQVITYEEYYPYGGTAVLGGNLVEQREKRYRFSAKELDQASGLYYFGHRYYSPYLTRWISADPAGPVDGPNLYLYAKDNPTTFVDPTGLCPLSQDARAYYMTVVDSQYRYLSPSEYEANYNLSFDIQHEIKMKNSLLFADENQHFSQKTEQAIISRFSEFSGLFMTASPLLGQVWDEANSRITNPSTGLDFRHDYTLTRSHMNNTLAEITPEFDFSTGYKTFETHHLLLKSKHPELAVTTQNMVLATRGSLSGGYVGLHEGLFHLLTAGQMGNLYSTEVAGVTGIIKRLVAHSQALDITDNSQLSSGGFGWLELEDRSKGTTVKLWSTSELNKKKQSAQARVTQYTGSFSSTGIGVISPSFSTTIQTQSKKYLSSGGSALAPMDID